MADRCVCVLPPPTWRVAARCGRRRYLGSGNRNAAPSFLPTHWVPRCRCLTRRRLWLLEGRQSDREDTHTHTPVDMADNVDGEKPEEEKHIQVRKYMNFTQ